jgi:hypothetical protein
MLAICHCPPPHFFSFQFFLLELSAYDFRWTRIVMSIPSIPRPRKRPRWRLYLKEEKGKPKENGGSEKRRHRIIFIPSKSLTLSHAACLYLSLRIKLSHSYFSHRCFPLQFYMSMRTVSCGLHTAHSIHENLCGSDVLWTGWDYLSRPNERKKEAVVLTLVLTSQYHRAWLGARPDADRAWR